MENSNHACYAKELEYCIQLITALEFIVTVCEQNPARYPALMADIVCLIHGRTVKANGNVLFINGLEQQIKELYDTMEALELEVLYEGGEDVSD